MRGSRPAGRLAFLDAVRGVAALTVAAGHAAELFSPELERWALDWFEPGRAGVCAFFLVSGFVIPISLERGGQGLARSGAVRQFTVGRLARLYPMYWCSLGLALLNYQTGVGGLPADFEAELPVAAFVNLTMAQELVGVPHAVGLYYTLTIELVWYVACAVLFALGWLRHTERLAWAAIAGLAVVGVGAPVLADRHTPFSTGFYLVTMLVGTALARHAAGTMATGRLASLVAGAGAVGLVGSWANYSLVPGAADPEGKLSMAATLLPWAAAYLLVFVAYRAREAAVPAALTWLGVVSYSVYLLHPMVLDVTGRLDASVAVKVAATLLVTVALATVTYRVVEAPGQRLGKRWRSRGRSGAVRAPNRA